MILKNMGEPKRIRKLAKLEMIGIIDRSRNIKVIELKFKILDFAKESGFSAVDIENVTVTSNTEEI
jgi:hypothetical protein